MKDDVEEDAGDSLPPTPLLSWARRDTLLLMEVLAVKAALEVEVPDKPDADMLAKWAAAHPRRDRLEEAEAPEK